MFRRPLAAIALSFALVGLKTAHGQAQKPQLLLDAEQLRNQMLIGEVEWTRWLENRGVTLHYGAKFDCDDRLFLQRGTDAGLVALDTPGVTLACSERRWLQTGSLRWEYAREAINASRLPVDPEDEVYDVRALGLAVAPLLSTHMNHYVYFDVASYRQEAQEGFQVVIAESAEGHSQEFWFKDGDPIGPAKVLNKRDGAVGWEARTTYRQYDGFWFPARVEYYRLGELAAVEEVASAAFNRPDHSRLTPELLEMPPGVSVGVGHRQPVLKWTGHDLAPIAEFFELRDAGQIDYGNFMALLAMGSRRGACD